MQSQILLSSIVSGVRLQLCVHVSLFVLPAVIHPCSSAMLLGMVQLAGNSRVHRTVLARLIWWLLVACTSPAYALGFRVAPCVSHHRLRVNVRLASAIHVNGARLARSVLAALVLGKIVDVIMPRLLCFAVFAVVFIWCYERGVI
jgi:hypothetical protein